MADQHEYLCTCGKGGKDEYDQRLCQLHWQLQGLLISMYKWVTMCEPWRRVDDNEDKARVDTTVSITVLVKPLMHQPMGLCKMDTQKLICEWRQCWPVWQLQFQTGTHEISVPKFEMVWFQIVARSNLWHCLAAIQNFTVWHIAFSFGATWHFNSFCFRIAEFGVWNQSCQMGS